MREHAKISPAGRPGVLHHIMIRGIERRNIFRINRRLGISVAGVGYSVQRGEIIARENDYQLKE